MKKLIFLFLLGYALYAGGKMVPIYYRFFDNKSILRAQASVSLSKSEDQIMTELFKRFKDKKLKYTEDNISIEKDDTTVKISLIYSEDYSLNLFGRTLYHKKMRFNPFALYR